MRSVAAQPPLPETVADDDDAIRGAVVLLRERPPRNRIGFED